MAPLFNTRDGAEPFDRTSTSAGQHREPGSYRSLIALGHVQVWHFLLGEISGFLVLTRYHRLWYVVAGEHTAVGDDEHLPLDRRYVVDPGVQERSGEYPPPGLFPDLADHALGRRLTCLQPPARQLPFVAFVPQQQHPAGPDDHALDRYWVAARRAGAEGSVHAAVPFPPKQLHDRADVP